MSTYARCFTCHTVFLVGASKTKRTCSNKACWLAYKSVVNRRNYYKRGGKPRIASPPVVLSEGEKGYIAGILDGEGWLGITARKRTWKRSTLPYYHRPVAVVGQSKPQVIDYLSKLLGPKSTLVEATKGTWNIRFHPPCLQWLLPQILPWLVLKRRQAEILIEFIQDCHYAGKQLTQTQWDYRERLRCEVMFLNVKPNSKHNQRK